MRALGLLLVLINLGFLAWTQLIDVREPPAQQFAATSSESKQKLMLASERKPEDIPPAQNVADSSSHAASGSTAAVTAEDHCVSLGPFQDLAAASQASAALSGAGFESKQRFEQGEFWVGYWVSVQDLPTRAAAETAIAKLKDAGVTDVYLLPGQSSSNIISLGVYSVLARAERRVDQIRALGLNAVMADRKRSGSVYWLDVELKQPGQPIDPAILSSQPGQIVRVESHPCPASSAG
jgi:hypothetical protein